MARDMTDMTTEDAGLEPDSFEDGIRVIPAGAAILTYHSDTKHKRLQEKCNHEWGPPKTSTLDRKELRWCDLCGVLATFRPQALL